MLILHRRRTAVLIASALALGGLSHAPSLAYATGSPPNGGASIAALDDQSPDRLLPMGGALPAVTATSDPLAVAAGDALNALWFEDPGYADKVAVVITGVALRARVSLALLTTAWEQAGRERMIVVLSALTQLGVPYRRFAMVEGKGFDCSGLTSWAWKQAGVTLPRQSLRQFRMATATPVARAKPGDLLYYPGHISLAIGVGSALIHSPYTGRTVEVRPMMKSRSSSVGAGSVIG